MKRPANFQALKRSFALPLSVVLLTLLLLPAAVFSAPLLNVFVNGIKIDSHPLVRDGVSYLPIQAMAMALQTEITWNANLNLVKVDGQAVGASVFMDNGKVYLPIESFVNALGGSVSFDGRINAIKITSGKSSGSPAVATANRSTPVAVTPASQPAKTAVSFAPPRPAATVQVPTISVSNGKNSTLGTAPLAPAARANNNGSSAVYGRTNTNQSYPSAVTNSASGNVSPGYPAAYQPNQQQTTTSLRPADAPPFLASNLQAGPSGAPTGRLGTGNAALPANAQRPNNGVYVPQNAQNSVFQVTVTNLETINVIKDFYRPKAGHKYVIAYLSQQNISQQVQIYTGRFSLLDQKSVSYDYIEGLSNFWLVILRPYGINFGYLVFEIPNDSQPISLVLHALNQAPLAVNL